MARNRDAGGFVNSAVKIAIHVRCLNFTQCRWYNYTEVSHREAFFYISGLTLQLLFMHWPTVTARNTNILIVFYFGILYCVR